ncbi:hypothetical protein DYW05_08810, partial [Campylobacter coli]|nr:hypothetical protein [Campylobacter coli]
FVKYYIFLYGLHNATIEIIYEFKRHRNIFCTKIFFQTKLHKIFNEILKYNAKELEEIRTRVKYYNQINDFFTLTEREKIGKFPFKNTSYAFDAYEISKYFNDDFL